MVREGVLARFRCDLAEPHGRDDLDDVPARSIDMYFGEICRIVGMTAVVEKEEVGIRFLHHRLNTARIHSLSHVLASASDVRVYTPPERIEDNRTVTTEVLRLASDVA